MHFYSYLSFVFKANKLPVCFFNHLQPNNLMGGDSLASLSQPPSRPAVQEQMSHLSQMLTHRNRLNNDDCSLLVACNLDIYASDFFVPKIVRRPARCRVRASCFLKSQNSGQFMIQALS